MADSQPSPDSASSRVIHVRQSMVEVTGEVVGYEAPAPHITDTPISTIEIGQDFTTVTGSVIGYRARA